MRRDSAATSSRILESAIVEFATYGFAGARIERVASFAKANVRSVYAYFESKEMLFSAAIDRVLTDMARAVPVDETDLPAWAGRVFDYQLEHPEAVRISLWRQLERPKEGPDLSASFAEKIAAISRAPQRATSSLIVPADLLAFIFGLTVSWFVNPVGLLQADGSDLESAERRAIHRAGLIEATRRLCE